MFIHTILLSVIAIIDAVPLNLQTHRASQVVDSENFHYRKNNPILCKKGLFSCFKPFSEKFKLSELERNPSVITDRNAAFENPKLYKSQQFIKMHSNELKKLKQFDTAENLQKEFELVWRFDRIEKKMMVMPFLYIDDVQRFEKFIHESQFATSSMVKNWESFNQKFNYAKLDYILENPKGTYSEKNLMIAGLDATLKERLGEGSYGVAYKAFIPSTNSFAVVKFPKRPFNEKSLKNELNALRKTEMLIAWDDEFKISVQKNIEGILLQDKIENLLAMNTIASKSQLEELKVKYDNLENEFFEKYGLKHGDIAPRNVIVDNNGKLHLIDFGMTTNVPQNENAFYYFLISKESADVEWKRILWRKEYIQAKRNPTDPASIEFIKKYEDLTKTLNFNFNVDNIEIS